MIPIKHTLKRFKILYFFIVLLLNSTLLFAQPLHSSVTKEQVIAQMNYCINSLTNIVHNKSMVTLEHEMDQLVNNLTIQQIVNIEDILNFRIQLMQCVGSLQITEEERNVMRRIQTMKKDNLMWQSISNALNPTMLIFPSAGGAVQGGFMALLTAARTVVEYKSAQGELEIEELQAMWELKKNDLKQFISLRETALQAVYNLYKTYQLDENDRLTEASATKFNEIIMEPNPKKRTRLLKDNSKVYEKMADYHYYLGMSYLDVNDYKNAKPHLDKYLTMYQETPIFRYDEKSGCVALSKLTYERSLSNGAKDTLIQNVLTNLPNNGAALMQCALIYLTELNLPNKTFDLLRACIDNSSLTDKDAVLMLISKLLPEIKKYPNIYIQTYAAINNCRDISFNSYIAFIVNTLEKDMWERLGKMIIFNDTHRLLIPTGYTFNLNKIHIYREIHKKNKLKIKQDTPKFTYGINKKKILKKVKCFKENNNLMYLFFEPLIEGEIFRVKSGLDYIKIRDGEYPGLEKFGFQSAYDKENDPHKDDRYNIADFCKKSESKNNTFITIDSKNKTSWYSFSTKGVNLPYFDGAYKDSLVYKAFITDYQKDSLAGNKYKLKFAGDTLMYQPMPFYQQSGTYIKIVFDGSVKTILTYKVNDKTKIVPYSVESNGIISFYQPQEIIKANNELSWWNNLLQWFGNLWRKCKFWE